MLFHFNLLPLDQVIPWGEPGKESLHWFGLTDGVYWLDVGEHELLRYSDEICARKLAPRYCEYQVVRLYEDLLGILPHTLEPVPAKLAPYLLGDTAIEWQRTRSNWIDHAVNDRSDDEFWEILSAADTWKAQRSLDTLYLSPPANIVIWSGVDDVHISWNNRDAAIEDIPAWSALFGTFQLPPAVFLKEVEDFHERLMQQMGDRISQVVRGVLPPHIYVNYIELQKEHDHRRDSLRKAIENPFVSTDWENVQTSISQIEEDMRKRYV